MRLRLARSPLELSLPVHGMTKFFRSVTLLALAAVCGSACGESSLQADPRTVVRGSPLSPADSFGNARERARMTLALDELRKQVGHPVAVTIDPTLVRMFGPGVFAGSVSDLAARVHDHFRVPPSTLGAPERRLMCDVGAPALGILRAVAFRFDPDRDDQTFDSRTGTIELRIGGRGQDLGDGGLPELVHAWLEPALRDRIVSAVPAGELDAFVTYLVTGPYRRSDPRVSELSAVYDRLSKPAAQIYVLDLRRRAGVACDHWCFADCLALLDEFHARVPAGQVDEEDSMRLVAGHHGGANAPGCPAK